MTRRAAVANLTILALALAYPWFMPRFWVEGIATEALILAIVGLSLTFMASYGGMVPLSQLAIGGVAAYSFAFLTVEAGWSQSGLQLWLSALTSFVVGIVAAALVGAVAVQTSGIYLLMLTLAVAVAFEAFARQNYDLTRGFDGYAGVPRPPLPAGEDGPIVFYYFVLAVLVVSLLGLKLIARSRFGLSLQAIRDNPERAASLGYRTNAHRLEAFILTGAVASAGGLLYVWYLYRIAPSFVAVGPTLDILILCVLGGLNSLAGPIIGALAFKLLSVFASDLIGPRNVSLLTGAAFLLVMMFSPGGIVGVAKDIRDRVVFVGRRSGGKRKWWWAKHLW